ncbi:hypothetical protein GCM10027516_38440 [Niabella aquatica]
MLEASGKKALCRDNIVIPGSLKVYSYLVKLIEAAHLINVREVRHVGVPASLPIRVSSP